MDYIKSEIWKSHPEIPGIEVSTLGNVRILDRVVSSEKGTQFVAGRVLKQCKNTSGYLQANIPIDGKRITKAVHRLVAQAFIKNTYNFPQVNHKDCNPINNNVDNLEWCTGKYNIEYREKYGKTLSRPVYAVNLKTSKVSKFKSQSEASRELGILQQSISKVIKGKFKQTHGFWFVNADDNAVNTIKNRNGKIIDGVFVKDEDLEE